MTDNKTETFRSSFPSIILLAICWLSWGADYMLNLSSRHYGLYPRTISGLKGIIFAPFIHGDLNHLLSNSMPILILGAALFYFYKKLGYKVVLLIWIWSGFMTWIIGRPSYHIGASGLIYGLVSFLFVSGLIRKMKPLMAIAFLVVFLYGSLVWGVLPSSDHISWEYHLSGFICGIIAAIMYKDKGPQRERYDWEEEDSNEFLV